MNRQRTIEETEENEIKQLTKLYKQLIIDSKDIANRIEELKQTRASRNNNISTVTDTDGNIINIGDTVIFLTKGKFNSSKGIVTKINEFRVTAKDQRGRAISRAPHNLRLA